MSMGILSAVLAAVTLATGDMPKGSKLLRGRLPRGGAGLPRVGRCT